MIKRTFVRCAAAMAALSTLAVMGTSASAYAADRGDSLHVAWGNQNCLDAENDAYNNSGDKVQVWACNGAANQQWITG